MHPSNLHSPQTLFLLLLLALSPTALSLPDPRAQQQHPTPSDPRAQQNPPPSDPFSPSARQRRLEAWRAQKPMHTTALLAGAAATAASEAQIRSGRRRDLSGVTGEKGMWIPAEFWDGEEQRGERVVVVEVEGEVEGEDVQDEEGEEGEEEEVGEGEIGVQACGVRDVVGRVWRNLQRIGLVGRRERERVGKEKELDNGHGGDL